MIRTPVTGLVLLLFACGASKTAPLGGDIAAEARTDTSTADRTVDLPAPGCKPGTSQCQGNAVAQCNAEGTAWETTGTCPAGEKCMEGACICQPDCSGKQCGDDGCGGSCGECGDGEACQGGSCVCLPNCAGKACGDDGCGGSCGQCSDGDACLGPEECQEGACKPGVPVVCDDQDPCTTDDCDPVSGCQHTGHAGECEDGNPCTEGSMCVGGICAGGEKVICDDGNPCTTDACSSVEGCIVVYISKPCDDSDPCTDGDVCEDGVCVSGDNVCFPCQANEDCLELDDGNLCNGLVGCVEGLCKSLADSQVVCDDLSDDCVTSACNGQKGLCEDSLLPDMTYCNDGDLCTVDDVCKAGVCAGKPVNCNDGDECTTDWCDVDIGCLHEALCPEDAMCLTGGECCFPNICGTPGMECGVRDSGCGQTVDCGDCPQGEECKEGVCSDGVCTAKLVSGTERGRTVDVAVEGDVAALAMGSGVWFLDVSTPEVPTLLSKFETEAGAESISFSSGLAVTGGWPGKLEFVHFDNASPPKSLSKFDISVELGWGSGTPEFDVDENWMAIGGGNQVAVLDLTGLPSIETVAQHSVTGGGVKVAISEGWLYAVSALASDEEPYGQKTCYLYALPLSSSSTPLLTPVAEFECSSVSDVACEDGRLIILAWSYSGSVHLYDVSNPDTPVHAGSLPGGGNTVRLSGSLACLGYETSFSQLKTEYVVARLLNVDTITQPELLGTSYIGTPGTSRCYLIDNVAYTMHWSQGLLLYDYSSPDEPTALQHSIFNPGKYGKAVLSGPRLIAASSTNGLEIYSLESEGPGLQLLSWLDITKDDRPVAVQRHGKAYISAGKGIKKVTITNPLAPEVEEEVLFSTQYGRFHDLDVPGDGFGYGIGKFVDNGEWMRQFVIFDAGTLEQVSEVVLPQMASFTGQRLLVHDDTVFVTSDGMTFVDVSDPWAPVLMEDVNTMELYSGSWGFASAGNWLFAAGSVAVHAWDISSSMNPVYVSSSEFIPFNHGVIGHAAGHLFAVVPSAEIWILDATAPPTMPVTEHVQVPDGGVPSYWDSEAGYAAMSSGSAVKIFDITGCW